MEMSSKAKDALVPGTSVGYLNKEFIPHLSQKPRLYLSGIYIFLRWTLKRWYAEGPLEKLCSGQEFVSTLVTFKRLYILQSAVT